LTTLIKQHEVPDAGEVQFQSTTIPAILFEINFVTRFSRCQTVHQNT